MIFKLILLEIVKLIHITLYDLNLQTHYEPAWLHSLILCTEQHKAPHKTWHPYLNIYIKNIKKKNFKTKSKRYKKKKSFLYIARYVV